MDHEPGGPELGVRNEIVTSRSIGQAVQAGVVHGGVHLHRPAKPPGRLDDAVEQLADAVRAQWVREVELRRAYDPRPLKVSWHVVDAELADHRDNVTRLPDDTRLDLADLSGSLPDVADVYRRVPSERLLVLGGPGSGKTVLAVHFVLTMLDARIGGGDRVPVLFTLGGWNPAVPLRDLLAGQLVRDHPMGPALAAELVDGNRILPVLDGFDEIAGGFRRAALTALSATTMPLVLTSRVDEYRAAVSDVAARLSRAAVVELDRLGVDDLADYLPLTTHRTATVDGAVTPVWSRLLAQVGGDRDDQAVRNVTDALSTPLMAVLARTVYSDASGPHPEELLDGDRFPTAPAIEEHLLASFVPAVYRSTGPVDGAEVERVERWFGFLARHLSDRDMFDLAWWELPEAVSRRVRSLLMGLFVLVGVGLPSLLLLRAFSLDLTLGLYAASLPALATAVAVSAGRRVLVGAGFAAVVGGVLGLVAVRKGLPLSAVLVGGCTVAVVSAVLYMLAGRSSPTPSQIKIQLWRRGADAGRKLRFGFGGSVFTVACVTYVDRTGLMASGDLWGRALTAAVYGAFLGLLLELMGDFEPRFTTRRVVRSVGRALAVWLAAHAVGAFDSGLSGFLPSSPVAIALGLVESRFTMRGGGGAVGRSTPKVLVRRWGSAVVGGLSGVLVGTVYGVVRIMTTEVDLEFGGSRGYLSGAVVTGAALGFVGGLLVGGGRIVAAFERSIDLSLIASPRSVLQADRGNVVTRMLVHVLPVGVVTALAVTPSLGVVIGLVTAAVVSLVVGMLVGVCAKAWGRWLVVVRIWLPLTGRLPWRLTAFLDDAHRRGVLRQAGAVYQFRHARLQAFLARKYSVEEAGRSA